MAYLSAPQLNEYGMTACLANIWEYPGFVPVLQHVSLSTTMDILLTFLPALSPSFLPGLL